MLENIEVRDYLYKTAPERLNSNPIFVKVFGEDFADKKLREFLKVVYTNEPDKGDRVAARQCGQQKSIVFYISGEDGALLTVEEFENNERLKEFGLHECIHAILRRSQEECDLFGISDGTGLLERIKDTNSGKVIFELGRGLNEGYTEWLVEKSGLKSLAFPELTNFVRLIEFDIGTEKTMELGKGNINVCFPKILDMPLEDVNYLLGLSDHLYNVDYNIGIVKNLINYFNVNKGENQNSSEYYQYIEVYKNNPVFLNYIKEKGLEVSDESLRDYLKSVALPELNKQRNSSIIRFESFVIEKYYIKDLNKLFKSKNIPEEEFQKCQRLVSVLNTDLENIPEEISNLTPKMSSIYVKEEFEKLKKKYIIQTAHQTAEKYNSGKLSLEELFEKLKTLCEDNFDLKDSFITEFSSSVNESFKSDIKSLLFFDKREFVGQSTTLYKLKSSEEHNGKMLSQAVAYSPNCFGNINYFEFGEQVVDSKSEETVNFDFTIGELDDEYEITIKNFLKLKEEVFSKNPNSKIRIASRMIVVEHDGNTDFYMIDSGEFVPMEVQDEFELKFCANENKKEIVAITPAKVGLLSKITNKLKSVWYSFKNKQMEDTLPNYMNENEGQIVFNSRLFEVDKFDDYRIEDFDKRVSEKVNKGEADKIRYDNEIENDEK